MCGGDGALAKGKTPLLERVKSTKQKKRAHFNLIIFSGIDNEL